MINLRCELSYALKKKKNIIPVFLAGVSGFPEDLPADVSGVTKKNGLPIDMKKNFPHLDAVDTQRC